MSKTQSEAPTPKASAPAPAPAPTPVAPVPESKPKAETVKKKEKPKKPPYYICDGKAVTSRKGTLSAGDEIKPEWVGGMKRIEELIDKEIVAKG